MDISGRIDRYGKAAVDMGLGVPGEDAEHATVLERIAVLATAVSMSRSARHENFALSWSADQSDFVLGMIFQSVPLLVTILFLLFDSNLWISLRDRRLCRWRRPRVCRRIFV